MEKSTHTGQLNNDSWSANQLFGGSTLRMGKGNSKEDITPELLSSPHMLHVLAGLLLINRVFFREPMYIQAVYEEKAHTFVGLSTQGPLSTQGLCVKDLVSVSRSGTGTACTHFSPYPY